MLFIYNNNIQTTVPPIIGNHKLLENGSGYANILSVPHDVIPWVKFK